MPERELAERFTICELEGRAERALTHFLADAWAEYHRAEGHDLAYDWRSRPVQLVARDGLGAIVGAVTGRWSAGVGHLSELMVAPAWRRRGVGHALLAEFERRCSVSGCHKLTVHTELHGPAITLYSRHGWEQEAVFRRDKGGRDFARLCKFVGRSDQEG